MSLPKISYPIHEITNGITNKKYKFRPLLVKEEKLLLMAKESETSSDIFEAIIQVINNCSLDTTFDVEKLALYELEYIFLKLRGLSIGNKIEISYKDAEDNRQYDFTINLEEVLLKNKNENINNKIVINDDLGIVMKFPPASLYKDKEFLQLNNNETMNELIIRCIDKIFDKENVYDPSLETENDLREFIDNLDIQTYKKIQEFFNNVPFMEYTIDYVNSLGTKKTINLRSLSDFFIL